MADLSLRAQSACTNPDAFRVAADASFDLDKLALEIDCAAKLICLASGADGLERQEQMAIDGIAFLMKALQKEAQQLTDKYTALSHQLCKASEANLCSAMVGSDRGAEIGGAA